jgi:ribonuclease PH
VRLVEIGEIPTSPLLDSVAAVSVGVVGHELWLDLDYEEDSAAEVDMNIVVTGKGRLVEVQATAERMPFSFTRMNALIRLAQKGTKAIGAIQKKAAEQIPQPRRKPEGLSQPSEWLMGD